MKAYAFERASVLLVDDSVWMRVILRQMLKSLGFSRIHEAEAGDAALALVDSAPPDIVLVDWDMKPMDGLELTRRLRRLPGEARYVPVIMISAYSTLGNVLAARNAGVNEFLVKPASPQTMYHHLVSVIERPRPFVEAPGYRGPDRRRRGASDDDTPRRRSTDHQSPPLGPADRPLSQSEITAIMGGATTLPAQPMEAGE
ncbi:response regulator [Azospirillum sp. TSO22-1]|uniref:response regulator n=1 Tax=Azospirillum sp. TSO22-1 TaxID=716789 RepID=UPI0011B49FD7|nr:response regulator [Azospirillum sp. TSO22-1]